MNFLQRLFKTKTSIITTLTITSSNGFHLRPIAQFVNEAKKYDATISLLAKETEVSATQVPKILSLSLEKGETFTLKCKGKEAQIASEELSTFFQQLMKNDKIEEKIIQESEVYEEKHLNGDTISKGIVIAPLISYELEHHINNSEVPVYLAIQLSIVEFDTQIEEIEKTKNEKEILLAQKTLLQSDFFKQNFKDSSEFKEAIRKEYQTLQGSKFESRIADYKDIEHRVLAFIGIASTIKVPDTPYILVVNELLPYQINDLKDTPIQGVILQSGTTTSHASILLRSAGIPSLIIKEEISLSKNAILDANSGNLVLNPSKNDLKKAVEKQKEFIETLDKSFAKRFEETATAKGKSIKVLANITDLNSAKEAKGLGADGVGLLRTEFLFTEHKPTVEEQTNAYREIFEVFNEVTVRTLDIGGDKSLPYISIGKEDNPFLGIRGIRFSLQEQTLFKEQLLAVGLASAKAENTKVKIMFPMVSTTEEFIQAKEIALNVYKENNIALKNIEFGIMLEVPSVIFGLNTFDKLVDFYSIGSNDLTQYLFAIERTHPSLSVDETSPLLMTALKQIRETSKRPISICGELAGLDNATSQLIEMGYSTLSVSAKLIPSLKEKIRNV